MRETGKQKSQRIQIDYYRHRGGLHRFRSYCIAAGFVGSAAYVLYALAFGGGSHLSTGPLARAHASFEENCDSCHQDFTPIHADASKLSLPIFGVSSVSSIQHIETACQACHNVGNHYRESMRKESQLIDQNCSICHVDHLGRLHDLSSVENERCTTCHASVSGACTGTPKIREKVLAFTKELHGDFRSLEKNDPGSVRFDHAQHMRAGQVDAGERGEFTLAMLDQSQRARYAGKGQNDSEAVQLNCNSCHELNGNPSGAETLVFDRELGRYMSPISFEQHCAACHAINPGFATKDTTTLPHAVAWPKIDLLLAATAAGARAVGQARIPRDDKRLTPVPGEGLGTASTNVVLSSLDTMESARERVLSQCLKCHDASSVTDQAISSSLAQPHEPMIPPRWFKHGLYDHAAHIRMDCRYCHLGAYPQGGEAKPATDQDIVMIAGIDSCTGCHRDSESFTPPTIHTPDTIALFGGQPAWASDRCTLCHRYHPPTGMTRVLP